jgi:superfamily II DNA or RNA helicase
MIATGTDIKPLECVVFMRSVKSRGLFEQMKGRGVRVIPDADFQAVTPGAMQKTHFVIVDCVGVMEEQKSDPPLDRDRGISFPKLLELMRAGNRDEDVLCTLAARLDRMDRSSPRAARPDRRRERRRPAARARGGHPRPPRPRRRGRRARRSSACPQGAPATSSCAPPRRRCARRPPRPSPTPRSCARPCWRCARRKRSRSTS